MKKEKVYIVGAKRSAIGGFMGTLKRVHPRDMGTQVLTSLLEETKVPKDKISEVIVGNILPANLGQGIARQISIGSGIPETVPAYSLNMVCGSGMKSIMNAYTGIRDGFADIVVAGGVESMSGAPYLVDGKVRTGTKMGPMTMEDHMLKDALTDAFGEMHMGITAENIAEKYDISREDQDEFAMSSQKRAIAAIDAGRFKDEIIPIEFSTRKGKVVFDTDEHPNRTTTPEILAKLRPAFKKDGSVTAGNSSGINDGTSFTIIASESAVKKYDLPVLAEVSHVAQAGVDPNYMGMGPVPAIESLLKRAELTMDDIELIELNEAFASQSLGVIREIAKKFGTTEEALRERTNVNGGAIALGHPVGVSGNRIVVTLLHEMIKRDNHVGLASLCIGGGMGTALIIKR
jgi:acetyl-CoA C-acetyltransferase